MRDKIQYLPIEDELDVSNQHIDHVGLEHTSKDSSVSQSHTHNTRWWESDSLYFLMITGAGLIPISYTIATFSIYNPIYSDYLYTYYVITVCNCACLVYPFFVPYFSNLHFTVQARILLLNGPVSVAAYSLVAFYLPYSRSGFYLLLVMNLISNIISYASLNYIIESFKFYPTSAITCYVAAMPANMLIISLILLPMSYFEVNRNTQLLFMFVYVLVFVFLAHLSQSRVFKSPYYQKKMEESQSNSENTPVKELLQEAKKHLFNVMMMMLANTCYVIVFPAMVSEINPPFVSYSTWSNTVSIAGYLFYVLSLVHHFEILENEAAQTILLLFFVLYTVYQSLVFCLVFNPNGFLKEYNWLVAALLGGVCISYQNANYQRFLMKLTVGGTEKRAISILMNWGLFIGFLFGGVLPIVLAEIRKSRLIIK